MVQRIALMGSKVETPFLGHLDAQVEDGDNVISVAARFAHQYLPVTTFQLVRKVESELRIQISKIVSEVPNLADWIMKYPNMAGQRAIMIGIALGTVSYCLRVILGIERTYLGTGD